MLQFFFYKLMNNGPSTYCVGIEANMWYSCVKLEANFLNGYSINNSQYLELSFGE